MNKDKKKGEEKPAGGWAFKPDKDADTSAGENDKSSVTWTASEYIAHHKGAKWYLAVVGVAVASAALAYLLMRDFVVVAVIIIVAVLFIVASQAKPRVLTYRLDNKGLTIGAKVYPYSNFKSFSLVQDGAFTNITLMPLRRFMPSLTVYFAPDDQQKIVEVLSTHLPMQPGDGEFMDRLMNRIRF